MMYDARMPHEWDDPHSDAAQDYPGMLHQPMLRVNPQDHADIHAYQQALGVQEQMLYDAAYMPEDGLLEKMYRKAMSWPAAQHQHVPAPPTSPYCATTEHMNYHARHARSCYIQISAVLKSDRWICEKVAARLRAIQDTKGNAASQKSIVMDCYAKRDRLRAALERAEQNRKAILENYLQPTQWSKGDCQQLCVNSSILNVHRA